MLKTLDRYKCAIKHPTLLQTALLLTLWLYWRCSFPSSVPTNKSVILMKPFLCALIKVWILNSWVAICHWLMPLIDEIANGKYSKFKLDAKPYGVGSSTHMLSVLVLDVSFIKQMTFVCECLWTPKSNYVAFAISIFSSASPCHGHDK